MIDAVLYHKNKIFVPAIKEMSLTIEDCRKIVEYQEKEKIEDEPIIGGYGRVFTSEELKEQLLPQYIEYYKKILGRV